MSGKARKLVVFDTTDSFGNRKEVTWICKKCGLERSNLHTHKHGDPL